MTETTVLEDLASKVAIKRNYYEEIKEEWENLCEVFNNRHRRLIDDLAIAKQEVADSEAELRAAGFAAYAETGTKQLPRGLGVRVTTKLDYDPAEALTWAKHHGLALQLDKAAFERIVKADTPDFVKMIDVVTITLPTDTAKLLGE